MDQPLKILVVEDNAGDAELIREMVADSGGACTLLVADRLGSALRMLESEPVDAVFLDLGLPDSNGIDTLRTLQEKHRDIPVIVLTGLTDGDLASRAIALGAQDYLTKGQIDLDRLHRSALYAIERKRKLVAMRKQKELSEALNRLNSVIHSTLDLDAILGRLNEEAAKAIGGNASVIGVLEGDDYVIRSAYNVPEELVGRSIASREMKGIFHATTVGDVVAFTDAFNDARLNREMIRTFDIRSMMVAPFMSKGNALGALSVFSLGRPFAFEEEHVDFARKLSFSIATALENARLYQALLQSEQLSKDRLSQLQAVYATAPVGLCFVDTQLRFVNINQWLAELNGTPAEEHLGRSIRDVLPPLLADSVEPYYRRAIETGNAVEDVELRVAATGPGRNDRYWLTSYYPVRDASDGIIIGVNAVVQEITARKKMEEEIRHLANHDPLTALPNRRLFLELIALERAQSDRRGTKMAVFFLDLDRFKNINDTLGHAAGDELLRQVAAGLRRTVRSSDTVARIGGDEFNLIIANINQTADVVEIARKVVDYFERTFVVAGQELRVTASLGISIFPDDAVEVDRLLRYADVAMYHAKERGRNNFQFYDPDINVRSIERIRLENWLSQSVVRAQLFIHYQPMVDIRTGRVVCAEALVRWRHPEMGVIDPAKFIPVAEETGLIASIDEWVLTAVCRQLRAWLDSGLPLLCITVNLSARLFEKTGLVDTVRRILKETEVPPEYLDLEITESMAMSNVDRTAARLKELVGMGIHISIDDFGTGYSSLNYLKRLPIERLKIDRSFVKDITTDPDDRTIISAVTAMAHNMKMRVLAEGVETEEQLEFLRATGCDEMQGFLFSRPLPAEELRELLRRQQECRTLLPGAHEAA